MAPYSLQIKIVSLIFLTDKKKGKFIFSFGTEVIHYFHQFTLDILMPYCYYHWPLPSSIIFSFCALPSIYFSFYLVIGVLSSFSVLGLKFVFDIYVVLSSSDVFWACYTGYLKREAHCCGVLRRLVWSLSWTSSRCIQSWAAVQVIFL